MKMYLAQIIVLQLASVPLWAVELHFESPMKIKKENTKEFSDVGPQNHFNLLRGESAIITRPQGLPLVIIVPQEESSKFVLTNSDLETMTQNQVADTVSRKLNEILVEMRRAETLIHKKDYAQAMSILRPLKNKYEQIAPIYFMSASVSYLLNDQKMAVDDLEKGLKLQPEDPTAKNLLEKLKGTK